MEMTTTETATMLLLDALAQAGVGGEVSRFGDDYTVGKDHNDVWTMSRYGVAEPYTTYVRDGWRVVSEGNPDTSSEDPTDEPSPATLRDLFNDVQRFQFVQGAYDTFIFNEWDYDRDDDTTVAKLIHSRYMSEYIIHDSELSGPCESWTLPTDDDGSPKLLDPVGRYAIRQLLSTRAEVRILGEQLETSQSNLLQADRDWAAINERINAYANEMQMCSDYERRIFGWNADFARTKLVGRTKTHRVTVRNDALQGYGDGDLRVTVEARSPEEAREAVRNMRSSEIFQNLMDSGHRMQGLTFEIDDEVDTM